MQNFMKKYFSLKLNKATIDRKTQLIQKEYNTFKNKQKIKKFIFYFAGFSFVSLYAYYLLKASGLMKSLEIDKKYKYRQKKIEEKYNVDIEMNDKKLKEFDEKWAINQAINEYENKLKYGNKELNKKEEKLDRIDVVDKLNEINKNDKNEIAESEEIISSAFKDKNREILKGKDYEQLKYYQGNKDNIDPTVMGNTIIFDTRLDRSKVKK